MKLLQVTNTHDRRVQVADGSYLRAELRVAGFALIEADSVENAVAKVAGTPCAIARGVVEVWEVEGS